MAHKDTKQLHYRNVILLWTVFSETLQHIDPAHAHGQGIVAEHVRPTLVPVV